MNQQRRTFRARRKCDESTPFRVRRRARCLALWLVALGTTLSAGAVVEPLDIRHERWTGYRMSETLPDGSSLVEYGAQTGSLSSPEILLRVGFVPRFACNAIVALYGDMSVRDALGISDPATSPELEIRIDGQPIGLPLSTDIDESIALYFRADIEALAALREQIDAADIATFRPPQGEPVVFSLFGSTAALGATESLCLAHEPEADVEERVDALAAEPLQDADEPTDAAPSGDETDASGPDTNEQ